MPDWEQKLRQFLQREHFSFTDQMAALNYRPAAVLILFWDEQGTPASLVTVRSTAMPSHAGEVSFPGGGLKPGEDHAAAALREAEEEIQLSPNCVDIVGRLDDAWSGAGFALAPMIGICASKPSYGTSDEVQRVVPFNLETELATTERSVTKFGHEIVGLSADLLGEAGEAIRGEYTGRGQRRHSYFLKYAEPRT